MHTCTHTHAKWLFRMFLDASNRKFKLSIAHLLFLVSCPLTLHKPHRRKSTDWPLSHPYRARRSWTLLTTETASWLNVLPAAAYKALGFVDQQRPTHRRVLRTPRRALPWQTPPGPHHLDPWHPQILFPGLVAKFPMGFSHACPFLGLTYSMVVLESCPWTTFNSTLFSETFLPSIAPLPYLCQFLICDLVIWVPLLDPGQDPWSWAWCYFSPIILASLKKKSSKK